MTELHGCTLHTYTANMAEERFRCYGPSVLLLGSNTLIWMLNLCWIFLLKVGARNQNG